MTQLAAPPAPRGFIARPRLTDRLDAGIADPTLFVCGPAGSGKSSLLAGWIAASEALGPVAWVSLEPADDDPVHLWGTVLASLRANHVMPRGSAMEALSPPARALHRSFLPRLVNALAELPAPVLLVLDDVHRLHRLACFEQLGFLLLHAPSTLRIALTARADPPLPLHVLRVRGRMTEIRADELAFTEEEAGELLAAGDVRLPADLVRALHRRTEGWAAGLRLAAITLRDHEDPQAFVTEFAGDDRVVGEYLLAEVLDRQSPDRRAFLLRTSIADRLCGGLADAITERAGGADRLAELAHDQVFLHPLDPHGGRYRYHGLFADLLRIRLKRERAAEVPELHRRAARWLDANGDAGEAMRHAVAAGDWDHLGELVASHWFDLFMRGEARSLRALMRDLPEERVSADAELAAAMACTELDAWDVQAARGHLRQADAAAAGVPDSRRRRFFETMVIARLYAARADGDFQRALSAADVLLAEAAGSGDWSGDAREALARCHLGVTALWAHRFDRAASELRRSADVARAAGLDYVTMSALSHLAMLEAMRGAPQSAGALGGEAIALAGARGWAALPQAAPAHLALVASALHGLRLGEAERHLERALEAAQESRERQLHLALANAGARLLAARGRPEDGLRAIDAAEAQFRGPRPTYERALMGAMRVRLLAACGRLGAGEALLATLREHEPAVPELAVAEAHLRLTEGDPEAAAGILRRCAGEAQAPLLGATRVEAPLLEAIALDELRDPATAATLERALDAAETEGHRWPFVSAGRRIVPLLRLRIREGTAHRALVGELLDALADREPVDRAVGPLLEPLSGRERAILRYLPTGLTNHEIASELFVSTNTVKTHLRSIYRKLDVSRRREAVERARDLRLLAGDTR